MEDLTTLESVLMFVVAWLYYFGTILRVAHYLEKSNGRAVNKAYLASLLWPVIVPYACVTLFKGRGL